MGRTKKIAIAAAAVIVIYTIFGFFILPPIVKKLAIDKLTEFLHRQTAIRDVEFNPYKLSLTVKGFVLKERSGSETFLSFDELYLNVGLLSIFKGGPVVTEVRLDRPFVNIARNRDLSYNFTDLLPKPTKKESPKFSINNIQIRNGSIDFNDMPKGKKHQIRDVLLTVPFISNMAQYVDIFVQPALSGKVNGTIFKLSGKTKPFSDSLETRVDLNLDDLDIPFYLSYSPLPMNFKVTSGRLGLKLGVSYVQYRDKKPTLNLNGSVKFKDLAVHDLKQNPMLACPAIDFGIASSDLISGKVHLAKVIFTEPSVDVQRDKAGRINLLVLAPDTSKEQAKSDKREVGAFSLSIDEFQLLKGRINAADFLPDTPFKAAINSIDLTVKNLSTSENRPASYLLSFKTDSEEDFKTEGSFSLKPLTVNGSLEAGGIPIRRYSPYYAKNILFEVKDGVIQISTKYAYARNENKSEARLSDLAVSLANLSLRKRSERKDFLNIPLFSLKGASVDLSTQEIAVAEVFSREGKIAVERLEDGTILLNTLIPETKKAGKSGDRSEASKPWLVTVSDLAFDRYRLALTDFAAPEPVHLEAKNIKVNLKGFSTAKNHQAKVSVACGIGQKGALSTSGAIRLNPFGTRLNVQLKDFDLTPFQPYVGEKVRLRVINGLFSTSGILSLEASPNGKYTPSYSGEASLRSFATIDDLDGDDFLKWDSLALSGLAFHLNPTSLVIRQVALTDFYSRIIISPDGSLIPAEIVNVENASPVPQSKPSSGPGLDRTTPKEPKPAIKVQTVTLQGGRLYLTDRHIKPSYAAKLGEITGRISGLSSEENVFADVDLLAKLDDYAPLEITGRINPLRDDLFVDLKASFKNMELSPLTPYSGKYLGYTIEKGKLSFAVQYQVVKRKLDSQNNILFDQFTLGDHVESPEATKLPVRLAIALLKDRQGQVDLNLPVSGTLDDPEFSIGRIIIKIIVNLITKAATAPFALLGSVFGGGEELSYVEFDYGTHSLTQANMAKLDKLVTALYNRPQLKLDIDAGVDREKDKEALRQLFFDRKVKARKLQDVIKKGSSPLPVDEVAIAPQEYAAYLKKAYKAEKFPKPRNIIGLEKDLPTSEMEKLMLAHIEITDDDLRQLASLRSKEVENYILKSGKVEPGRIFLVEAETAGTRDKEKVKKSRVDFKLH